MILYKKFFLAIINSLTSNQRRIFLVFIDIFLIISSIKLTFWLQDFSQENNILLIEKWVYPFSIIFGVIIYSFIGYYKGLIKYVRSNLIYKIAFANIILFLLLFLIGSFFKLTLPPNKTWFLIWLLNTLFISSAKFVFRDILIKINHPINTNLTKIAIYGAGSAGAQLAGSIRYDKSYTIEAFLDDDPNLWNRSIGGIPIFNPENYTSKNIHKILIAIPSLKNKYKKKLFNKLEKFRVPIFQVPSLEEISSGKSKIDNIRPISVEDLLGRDPAYREDNLLRKNFEKESICVIGAGGSIGMELCRQILEYNPKRLVLLEISEISLYEIEKELLSLKKGKTELKFILGSATNKKLLRKIFKKYFINIIYHAAAYKHVPIVESNPLSGISNNVFSTLEICEEAIKSQVDKVVIISTDKAVRPTNVMGSTKRLSELIALKINSRFKEFEPKTKFSIVRFGNVLGSSGSVVPLFKKQIDCRMPITLTHPDIIRYFMTIKEAVILVLQASIMSNGGEIFLLDMGEPVHIFDLAKKMIKLSGLTIKDNLNPNGDIKIEFIGLRPGEKMYEELLLNNASEPTPHKLIFKSKESIDFDKEFWGLLNILREKIELYQTNSSLEILEKLVPEWKRSKFRN